MNVNFLAIDKSKGSLDHLTNHHIRVLRRHKTKRGLTQNLTTIIPELTRCELRKAKNSTQVDVGTNKREFLRAEEFLQK